MEETEGRCGLEKVAGISCKNTRNLHIYGKRRMKYAGAVEDASRDVKLKAEREFKCNYLER